jgi:hypothetical protein
LAASSKVAAEEVVSTPRVITWLRVALIKTSAASLAHQLPTSTSQKIKV